MINAETKVFTDSRTIARCIPGITEWLKTQKEKGFDTIEVRVGYQGARLTKAVARRLLVEQVMGRDARWEKHRYAFDFNVGAYKWKGELLHITPGEAWFLYRWLMLGRHAASQAPEIQHLRKRYGPAFLREVTGRA
jgi:hypothetical protein